MNLRKRTISISVISLVACFAFGSVAFGRDFIIRNATTSSPYFMAQGTTGYIGVGTIYPSSTLHVIGTATFGSTVVVGTPTASGHAATKSYVDTVAAGGTLWSRVGGATTSTYLTNTGDRIGLGTSGPLAKVDIGALSGSVEPTALRLSGGATAGLQIRLSSDYSGSIGTRYSGADTYFASNAYQATLNTDAWAKGSVAYSASAAFFGISASTSSPAFQIKYSPANNASGTLVSFFPNTLFTVLGSGDVGIGTTGPTAKLQVAGASAIANNTSIDPDSYASQVVAGAVADGSGWGVSSGIGGNAGTGYSWGIGATNSGLYMAYGNGSAVNTFQTFLQAKPDRNLALVPTSGSVGIGNASPSSTLHVSGTGQFNSTVIVGTPTADGHAATKSYVDTVAAGGTLWTRVGTSTYATNTGDRVGVGTSSPGQKLDVSGNIRSSASLLQGTLVSRPYATWSVGGTSTGAVLIKLPGTVSNYGMVHMEINVYEYNGNSATTYVCGGHNWNGVWYNYSCNTIGVADKKIRLAVKDNQYAVVIGEASSTWSYGHVVLSKITNGGYYSNQMDLGGTYTITQDAAAESFTWVSADLNKFSARTGYFIGDVGIGTAPGTYKLNVSGTGGFTGTVVVGTPTASSHATTKSYVDSAIASVTSTLTTAFLQNGNSFAGAATLGTNNAYPLGLEVGGTTYLTVATSGYIGIGTTGPEGKLAVSQNMSDYGASFTSPHIKLMAGNTVDTTGFVGITYAGSTSANYGWSVGALRSSNGQSDFIWKHHNNSAVGTEWMRILNTGSVGIGNTSPSSTLHVTGGIRGTGASQFDSTVIVGTPTASSHAATKAYVDTAVGGGVGTGTTGQTLRHNGTGWIANSTLYNNGTSVGIGTASPQTTLHAYSAVAGSGTERTTPLNVLTLEAQNTSDLEYNGFGQAIVFRGVTYNNSTVRTLGRIVHTISDDSGNTTRGTAIRFETSDNAATTTAPTEKMRIDYNGYVGIGNTSPSSALHVTGGIRGTGASQFDSTVIVGTPTAAGHATTKSYVDTVAAGGTLLTRSGAYTYMTNTGDSFGIGTATPGTKLDIYHATSASLRINSPTEQANGALLYLTEYSAGDHGALLRYDGSANRFGILTGSPLTTTSTERISILRDSGYVGINTISPSSTLHVTGGIRATTASQFDSTVVVGTPTAASHATTKSYVDSAIASVTSTLSTITGAFIQNGNSFGGVATLGTNDAYNLAFETGGTIKVTIGTNGYVGIGSANPTQALDLAGSMKNLKFAYAHLGEEGSSAATVLGNNIRASTSTNTQMEISNSAVDAAHGLRVMYNNGFMFLSVPQSHGLAVGTAVSPTTYGKMRLSTAGGLSLGNGYVSTDPGAGNMIISGSLGVGTWSPSSTLHVVGGIRGTAASQFDSTVIVGTPTASGHATTKSYVDSLIPIKASNLATEDNRTISPSEGVTSTAKFGFTSFANNNSAPYADYFHMRSYSDATGGNDNLLMFSRSAIHGKVWQQAYATTTAYSSYRDIMFGNGSAGYLPKFSDYDYVNNSAMYQNGTSIGIGNTSPSSTLHVTGSIRATTASQFDSTVVVGTPTASSHATTKSYVDSAIANVTSSLTNAFTQNGNSFGGTATLGTNDAYPLGLEVGGATYLTVATSGYIGIGFTTPSKPLDIRAAQSEINLLSTTGTNRSGILMDNTGAGVTFIGTESSAGGSILAGSTAYAGVLGTTGALPLQFGTNNAVNMTMLSDGSIGIGNTSPSSTLHVTGGIRATTASQFDSTVIVGTPTASSHATTKSYVDSAIANVTSTLTTAFLQNGNSFGGTATLGTNDAYPLGLEVGGATYLTVATSGYIGIGTTGPGAKLDVVGDTIIGSGTRDTVWPLRVMSGYAETFTSITKLGFLGSYESQASAHGLEITMLGGATPADRYVALQMVDRGSASTGNLVLQNNGGSVGIGNTSPSSTLHVTGGIRATTASQFDSTVIVGTPTASTHATTKSYVDTVAAGGTLWTATSTGLYVTTTTSNVGIGTVSPADKLSVYGGNIRMGVDNGTAYVKLGSINFIRSTYDPTGVGAAIDFWRGGSASEGILAFSTNPGSSSGQLPTERMRIDQNGYVGINNTSPSSTLHVTGGIRATTASQFDSTVIVGTPTAASHATTKSYVDSAVALATSTQYWALSGTDLSPQNTAHNIKLRPERYIAGIAIPSDGAGGYLHFSGTCCSVDSTHSGYGVWLNYNSYFNGSNWIQPRGDLSSFLFTSNYHAGGWGWYYSAATGVSGATSTISRVAKMDANGSLYLGGSSNPTNRLDVNGSIAIGSYAGTTAPTGGLLVSGSVGIGNTSPSSTLHVSGTGQFTSTVLVGTPTVAGHAATKSYVDTVAAGGTIWSRSGSNVYVTTSTDYVGIGGASPVAKLDVVGGSIADPALQLARSYDGGRMRIKYSTATDAYGEIGMTYQSAGKTAIWMGANLNSFSAAHQGATQGNASSSSWLTRYDTISDYYAIRRIAPGAGTTASDMLYINSSGSVGIGNTSPSSTLHVTGGIRATTASQFDSTVIVGTPTASSHATTKSYVDSAIANVTSSLTNAFTQNGNSFGGLATLGTNDAYPLGLEVGGATYLTVATSGYIGIGTATPGARLDLKGTAGAQDLLRFSHSASPTAAGIIMGFSSDETKFNIQAEYSDVVYHAIAIDRSNRYVGIGNTSPSSTLHVTGGIRATTASQFDSTVIVGTPTASTHATTKSYVDSNFQPIATDALWSLTGSIIYASSTSRQVGIGGTGASAWAKLDVRGGQIVSEQSTGTGYDNFDGTGGSDGSRGLRVSWTSGYGASLEAWDGGSPKWGIFRWNATSSYPVMQGAYTSNNVYFSGNVGINTTTTAYMLDVSGTGQFTGTVIVGTPTASSHATTKSYVDSAIANVTSSLTNAFTQNGNSFGGTATLGTNDAYPLGLEVGGATYLTVATSGYVGIGTSTPGSRLHIYGTGTQQAKIETISNSVVGLALNSPAGNWSVGLGKINNDYFDIYDESASASRLHITSTGLIGIGTTAPSSTLHVSGGVRATTASQFDSTVIVGTPTVGTHAVTKSYVDTNFQPINSDAFWNYSNGTIYSTSTSYGIAIGGTASSSYKLNITGTANISSGLTVGGTLTANGGMDLTSHNITGVNKITVTTIDPVYRIGGINYATYAGSFAGGVKEEYSGRAKLVRSNAKAKMTNDKGQMANGKKMDIENSDFDITGTSYEHVIDFSSVPVGSDLWLWYKAVDFAKENMEAVATPYGQSASIYYVVEGKKIIFRGDKPAEFSFRLTGKRHDWRDWPTKSNDQNEKPSFIME